MGHNLNDAHAKERVVERYGGNHSLEKLLRKIRDGKAKFVCFGYQGRLLYDVPTNIDGKHVVIRVVVNPEKTVVISVLPPMFRAEMHRRAEKKRKQEFFRGFEDDEEAVAAFGAMEN